jgi:membrane protein
MFSAAKKAINDFIEDDCPSMAAALAYYTIFSLPPLLVLVVSGVGFFFGEETVSRAVKDQAGQMIGQEAAVEVETMMREASKQTGGGWWKALLGFAALLFGATTAFAQLQTALNRAWEVEPDPNAGGIKQFIGKRLLSFGFIVAFGFLLLVSLVISAGLAAAGGWLEGAVGGAISEPLMHAINFTISLLIVAVLFGAMFKYLPDAKISWREVGLGAILTAILFVIGKFLLGWYIGTSDVAGAYGTAGSVILILVWVYYSSMIVLLGAEFTQAWAAAHGRAVEPEEGAVRRPEHGGTPQHA